MKLKKPTFGKVIGVLAGIAVCYICSGLYEVGRADGKDCTLDSMRAFGLGDAVDEFTDSATWH